MEFSRFFISGIGVKNNLPDDCYYSKLAAVKALQKNIINIEKPVTFFVGENGIGKSTLVEAIAIAMGFNPEGGTKSSRFTTADSHSDLWQHMYISKGINAPKDGFFLRAESFFNLASYVDKIDKEPSFDPPVIGAYGGISLHERSHGESFLALVENRFFGNGIYILDEPEAALSPRGLLRLLVNIDTLVKKNSQFIISTHSPILMTYPDSDVLNITENGVEKKPYYETDHYLLTKEIINNSEHINKYLYSE